MLLRMPEKFAALSGLLAGESTRHGGVSAGPYASLNLGKSTADDPAHVAENRRRFFAALGARPEQLAWAGQVHGDQIRHADEPGGEVGYDALVTDTPGVLVGVTVADCTPILIADLRHRAVAAVHAGWRGTAAGLVAKTLVSMERRFGTRGGDCVAYVGTCIDEASFEVGPEVAEHFTPAFRRLDAARGKWLVDLKAANAAQLEAFGIPPAQIEISPYSTVLHRADYFSHRADGGVTGRMLAVVGFGL
jgi:YfiH family protein